MLDITFTRMHSFRVEWRDKGWVARTIPIDFDGMKLFIIEHQSGRIQKIWKHVMYDKDWDNTNLDF